MHPVIRIGADELAVVPSLNDEHVLGWALRPTSGAVEAWDVQPTPSADIACLLVSKAVRATHATMLGWRDVALFGVLGYALKLPDTLYAKYHGCVIVQNGVCVGIMQATHNDAWGYPADLLLEQRVPRSFAERPLRIVGGFDEQFYARSSHPDWLYSLTYRRHVRDPGRALDRNTVNGIPSLLLTLDGESIETKLKPACAELPADTRCIDVGGVVIGPGSVVVDVARNAQLDPLPRVGSRVTQLNGTANPLFEQMIAIFTNEHTFVMYFDDDCVKLGTLAPRELNDVIRVRDGVAWWGFCEAALASEFDAIPATPSEFSANPRPESPLIDFDTPVFEAPLNLVELLQVVKEVVAAKSDEEEDLRAASGDDEGAVSDTGSYAASD
jgi:hypothetical protein